jgi:hypothetical protein
MGEKDAGKLEFGVNWILLIAACYDEFTTRFYVRLPTELLGVPGAEKLD